MRNVLGGGGGAGALEAGMCLVTNEGRAPARTAGPPLRLPRPLAARRQVAGEGAARRWPGAGGRRAARGPGRRPAAERAQRRRRLWAFRRFLSPPERGRKEGRREGRKRGRRGQSRWKVQAEAPSPCGCTGRRAAPGAAVWPGGARRRVWAVCMRVRLCVCLGTGKGHVCLGCALWGAGSAPLCLFPEVGGTLARSGNVP